MTGFLTALTITTAVLSIILAYLRIIEFCKNRPILKFTFMYPAILFERGSDEHESWFILNITNIRQRPILVKNFYGIDKAGNNFMIMPDAYDPRFQYPKNLKETDDMSLKADLQDIKSRYIKELGVHDSSGKKWKLNKKQIKQINKKSQELRDAQ